MKALLKLKCDGFQKDGFVFCSGVENVILDLETIEATKNYLTLIKYLDSVSKLFQAPAVSMNVISNTLYKLYELGYADEKMNRAFSYFYNSHKLCGPILTLEPK